MVTVTFNTRAMESFLFKKAIHNYGVEAIAVIIYLYRIFQTEQSQLKNSDIKIIASELKCEIIHVKLVLEDTELFIPTQDFFGSREPSPELHEWFDIMIQKGDI